MNAPRRDLRALMSADEATLRHLVVHELSETELRLAAGTWDAPRPEMTPTRPRVRILGPTRITATVREAITPLCAAVSCSDREHSCEAQEDLVIVTLPWARDLLAGRDEDRAGALLPLAFGERDVTVGPVIREVNPCWACVESSLGDAAERPTPSLLPTMTAFAAAASGLLVRATAGLVASSDPTSLTLDLSAGTIQRHRWRCWTGCAHAA